MDPETALLERSGIIMEETILEKPIAEDSEKIEELPFPGLMKKLVVRDSAKRKGYVHSSASRSGTTA